MASPPQSPSPRSDRDQDGRFAPGNRSGKGNPFGKRVAALHTALLDAVEPRMIEAVAKRLVKSALEGDVPAAKVLLERVLGRGTPCSFKLPRIESSADLPKAMNHVLQAAAKGEVSSEDAARFATLVDATGRAIAAAEIEERLAKLEASAGLGPRAMAR